MKPLQKVIGGLKPMIRTIKNMGAGRHSTKRNPC